MHELLAVCYIVIDRDSLVNTNSTSFPLSVDHVDTITEAMEVTLDRKYIEHDSFSLFQEIMKSGKAFYEWRSEEVTVRKLSAYWIHQLTT
jgi:TBC1 domain family protein 5